MSQAKNTNGDNNWAITGQLDSAKVKLLGDLPGRWGRMTPLSRLMIVKVGSLLQDQDIVLGHGRCVDEGLIIGLVGATRRGSLHTDETFLESMKLGPGLASPAQFGYTLANIPLAEAASHFGLVGPAYAIFDVVQPFTRAVEEAQLLLNSQQDLTLMIACEFDHYQQKDGSQLIDARLQLVQRNAEN